MPNTTHEPSGAPPESALRRSLALPAAAQAADYRGQLTESISSGAPGVSPSLTLPSDDRQRHRRHAGHDRLPALHDRCASSRPERLDVAHRPRHRERSSAR